MASLLEAQATRGPDDRGFLLAGAEGVVAGRTPPAFGEATVALFHRRLSILDLTESGWQPMSTEDGRFHVVYNGEIVNYRELRTELEQVGHRFVTESDTEVLLKSHVEWGSAAPSRFEGMFAYALLDLGLRSLTLVRDFFGIKPLFYRWTPDGLVFASQISTVLQLASGKPGVNPSRLHDYLRYGMTDHGGETMFADVLQVPAAHIVEIALDTPTPSDPRQYWTLERQDLSQLSFESATARTRALFLESVERHMRSDVPIGTALSGGIDSSSIVMAMRHLLGREVEIHAFGYVSDDASKSEERWIDLVGTAASATVHKVRFDHDDLLGDLDTLVRAQEEPFGSLSIYAQNRVFRAAAEAGITVMLDGQGADELLGGYDFFKPARLASLLRQRRLPEAWQLTRAVAADSDVTLRRLVASAVGHITPASLQPRALAIVGEPLMPAWLDSAWFRSRGVEPRIVTHTPERETLRAYLERSMWEINLPHLLRYEDKNSMAYSIESRVPFLTPALATHALNLPESYLVGGDGQSKRVFRAAMRGLVPDPVLDRQDKIGFEAPDAQVLARVPGLMNAAMRDLHDGLVAGIVPAGLAASVGEMGDLSRSSARVAWRAINVVKWADAFNVSFD